MKILFLLRDPAHGLNWAAEILAEGLRNEGNQVDMMYAEPWMPKQTGPKVDKVVSPKVVELVKPYQLVHAWGYRAAWACGEALKTNKKWVFTAYEPPKTTDPELIDRLSTCRYALCSSKMVGTKLLRAGVDGCKTVHPGLNHDVEPLIDQEEAKKLLGLDPDKQYIGVFDLPNVDWDELETAMKRTTARVPEAELLKITDDMKPEVAYAAVEQLVFPQRKKGFSMRLLDAMRHGVACVVYEFSGLGEVIEDRYSGLTFEDPESLGDLLATGLQMPLRTEGIREQAKERIRIEFTPDIYTQRVLRLYDKVVGTSETPTT